MTDPTTLYVAQGEALPDDLQDTIAAILADIASGTGKLADEARAVGLTPGAELTITVQETGQGFLTVAALAIIFVKAGGAAAGSTLAKKFWEDVLLPEIRRRRGADAVGDVVEPD